MDEWHVLTAKLTKLTFRIGARGLDCAPEQPLLLECARDLQALDDNAHELCGREHGGKLGGWSGLSSGNRGSHMCILN